MIFPPADVFVAAVVFCGIIADTFVKIWEER